MLYILYFLTSFMELLHGRGHEIHRDLHELAGHPFPDTSFRDASQAPFHAPARPPRFPDIFFDMLDENRRLLFLYLVLLPPEVRIVQPVILDHLIIIVGIPDPARPAKYLLY